MILFLNKEKTIKLDDIVLLRAEKNKNKKRKTVIITRHGKKIIEKNNLDILIKRIEKQQGFLKVK